MKRKILQATVGCAMAVSASVAMAYNPATTTTDYQIYITGSSAVSQTVLAYVKDTLCNSNTTVFRRYGPGYGDGTTSYGNGWAVACHVVNNAPVTGLSQDSNVIFIKRDAGGSGVGVMPVLAPDFNNAGVALGAQPHLQFSESSSVNGCTVNPGDSNEYDCGAGDVTDQYSDAGFSDVEPSKFKGSNAPPGFPDFNSVPMQAYNAQAVAALTLGVPVNKLLRDALQLAQFPSTSICSPQNSAHDQGSVDSGQPVSNSNPENGDLLQCMPSLTPAELRSVYNGGITDWSQYLVHSDPDNSASSYESLIALVTNLDSALLPTAEGGTNHYVEICRRTPGSGTQASSGILFLNSPCDPTVAPMYDTPGNPFGGPKVDDGSGATDVGKCLDSYSTGTGQDGFNSGNIKRWAFGVQFTTENTLTNTNPRLDYRFIKVNGVAPDIKNVWAGDYPFYAEESYQYRSDAKTMFCAYDPALTYAQNMSQHPVQCTSSATALQTDIQKILAYIGAHSVTPAALGLLDQGDGYPWGTGGWLAIPGGSNIPTSVFDYANPINTSTRAPFGHLPNTCQPATTTQSVIVDGPVL